MDAWVEVRADEAVEDDGKNALDCIYTRYINIRLFTLDSQAIPSLVAFMNIVRQVFRAQTSRFLASPLPGRRERGFGA
jgi:hypothetical protein